MCEPPSQRGDSLKLAPTFLPAWCGASASGAWGWADARLRAGPRALSVSGGFDMRDTPLACGRRRRFAPTRLARGRLSPNRPEERALMLRQCPISSSETT